jgi:hypothetical protein
MKNTVNMKSICDQDKLFYMVMPSINIHTTLGYETENLCPSISHIELWQV